mgnify:CR=1 FL=1
MLGARMHYAVPRILHQAGHLQRLYTDLHFPGTLARAVQRVGDWVGSEALVRAGTRRSGLPTALVKTFPMFAWEYSRRLRAARTDQARMLAYLWGGQRFCELVRGTWVDSPTALYGFNSASLELLDAGRSAGARLFVEQTISPRLCEIRFLQEANEAFPGWSDHHFEPCTADDLYAQRERSEWSLADRVIAGSEFVREGLVAEGCAPEKICVVPYGVDPAVSASAAKVASDPPLALFVGRVNLRKGAPLIEQAARRLAGTVRFRAVGAVDLPDRARSAISEVVELAGPIPRTRVWEEYQQADLFIFPSFCEGSATVVYEALASGLPVVTTPNAGSVVREGAEGFVVEAGDLESFTDRVETLARNADLRAAMSDAARRRAADFTVDAYAERLLNALALGSDSRC